MAAGHNKVSKENQKRSRTSVFGDAPLPKYDPYFIILPSRDEARASINICLDFAYPTHRFLHKPTVEKWVDDFYDGIGQPREELKPGECEVRALILVMMAHARLFDPNSAETGRNCPKSAMYFGASEYHLGAERGSIRLTSVQARLAQCFYLVAQCRINHAWSLIGQVVQHSYAIGLHRKTRRDEVGGSANTLENEMRRRTFWCAFSLDGYLSAALGRPRSFHMADIDQDFPQAIDDGQLVPGNQGPLASFDRPSGIMHAPVCHSKLMKVVSGILQDMYGISRLKLSSRLQLAKRYAAELEAWHAEIKDFIDVENVEVLMPLFQRQYHVLNFAYGHAQVLLYRQFLLEDAPQHRDRETVAIYTNRCLNAATRVVDCLSRRVRKERMYPAFWFTHYYTFSAIVVLYVFVMQNRHRKGDQGLYHESLETAQRGQNDLLKCCSTPFVERGLIFLEELKREALARIAAAPAGEKIQCVHGLEHKSPVPLNARVSPYPASTPLPDALGENEVDSTELDNGLPSLESDFTAASFPFLFDGSPEDNLTSLAIWTELDSFAMNGMNELGSFSGTGTFSE